MPCAAREGPNVNLAFNTSTCQIGKFDVYYLIDNGYFVRVPISFPIYCILRGQPLPRSDNPLLVRFILSSFSFILRSSSPSIMLKMKFKNWQKILMKQKHATLYAEVLCMWDNETREQWIRPVYEDGEPTILKLTAPIARPTLDDFWVASRMQWEEGKLERLGAVDLMDYRRAGPAVIVWRCSWTMELTTSMSTIPKCQRARLKTATQYLTLS